MRWIPSFDEFISPIEPDRFLRTIFGQRPVFVSGHPLRFSYLLTWGSLNRILSQHRPDHLSLRIIKNGKALPIYAYTESVLTDIDIRIPQLNLAVVNRKLREGASIVVNRFRELHEPVLDLTNLLEPVFGAYVEAAVFAGWHNTEALGLHWDANDVFILQLEGRKHWRVLQPDKKHPIAEDQQDSTLTPPESSYWEGDLNPGDLLYIPRGWWHEAKPYSEATLSLSLIVKPPNGLDLVAYMLHRLSGYEQLRANLPRSATDAEKIAYMEMIRKTIGAAMQDFTLDEFLHAEDSRAPARGRLSLPWSAVPNLRGISASSWVCWRSPRQVIEQMDEDQFAVETFGLRITFARAFLPVLRDVIKKRRIRFGELRMLYPTEEIEEFVLHLTSLGLVWIENDDSSSEFGHSLSDNNP